MQTPRPDEDLLLFAVPKKGRLNEEVMKLLSGAGLDAKRPERLDVAICKDLPVKLVFLPAHDIPSYVMEGNIDLGITGSDMVEETLAGEDEEKASLISTVRSLGFGKCSLCVQAPKELNTTDASIFVGKRIVTSFPNITRRFFKGLDEKIDTPIRVVSGSVEAACGLGLADAIVDLVETGTTMRAAGLEVVTRVFDSESVLIRQVHKDDSLSAEKEELISLITARIDGYLTAKRHVMVVYNCETKNLAKCCEITPGRRSPTVTDLKEEGWHSVSSLVLANKSNSIMDALVQAGAQDILCFSLTNTRM